MKLKSDPLIATITLGLFFTASSMAVIQVPPGFEELAKGQTLWLDVSLYGQSLGLYQAKVNLENIQFIKPEALATAVHDKYNSAPDLMKLLSTSLKNALPRNGQLACSATGSATGCDYIDTKNVAVIYDENNARVSLFLAKEFLPEVTKDDPFYHATPDSHNAFIHQQTLNFVTLKDYQSASIQGNGTLGLTQNGYANLDWTWQGQRYNASQYQKADIRNAYLRQDLWKRVYLQGGVMDARDIFSNAGGSINLSLLPIGKIHGVRAGSTMAWTNQAKASHGTPVTVFLSRDSRVDVYRDRQLLTSFYLRAGAQALDTRSFPPGSYTVTLNIYEGNTLVRTQSTPYTGTGSAPLNTFQWFLQGGTLVNEDGRQSSDDNRVVQAGMRVPLTANTSLTTGATLLSDARYWETAIDWTHAFNSGPVDGVLTARLSYLYGTDGSRGNVQQLNYNDGFSLSFFRSSLLAPDCGNQTDRRYSYSGCYSSSSLMFSMPVADWYSTLGYSVSENEGRYVTRSQLPQNDPDNPGVPWDQVWTTRSRSRTWQAGLSRYFTTGGMNINTSLNAFVRKDSAYNDTDRGGFITVSMSMSGKRGDNDTRTSSNLEATYQSSQQGSTQLSYNASHSRYFDDSGENEWGASVYGLNSQGITASTWARAGGQYGTGSLTLSDAYDARENRHTPGASGNYSSSLVIDQDGLFWGRWGDGTPSSAITLGVENDDDNSAAGINVSLDTGGRADVTGNRKALFTVPGYREATLNIAESGKAAAGVVSEISRGAGVRTVFMPPGKVFNRDVSVRGRYTWLGRMQDQNHQPLEGAIPLNVLSWSDLGGGAFSLETERLMKTLYVMRDHEFWQCSLNVRSIRNVIRYVGTTVCEGTSMARLPSSELKQVELMTADSSGEGTPTAKNER